MPDLCDPAAARAAVEKYGYINKRPPRARQAQLLHVPAFTQNSSQRSAASDVNVLLAKPAPQKVTIMANGKRRIQPSLIATLASTEAMPHAGAMVMPTMGAFAAVEEQPLESQSRIDGARQALLQDVSAAFGAGVGGAGPDVAREMRPIAGLQQRHGGGVDDRGLLLPVPDVQAELRSASADGACEVAASNRVGSECRRVSQSLPELIRPRPDSVVSFRSPGSTWQAVAPAPVIALAYAQHVVAAATAAATLVCYSTNGSR